MTEPKSPPHEIKPHTLQQLKAYADLSVPDGNLHKSMGRSKKSAGTARVQSKSTVNDATYTWRGWRVREQPVRESMDISPAEANVVVWAKGTKVNEVEVRVNNVEMRVNEVGTRVKGKSKVVIDENPMISDGQLGNDDVSSSTNNWKG